MDYFDPQAKDNFQATAMVSFKFHQQTEQLLMKLGVPAEQAWIVSNTLYSHMIGPQLHYHTPVHILFILDFAEKYGIKLHLEEELAISFHDSIYDPLVSGGKNERYSALFMEALIGSYVEGELLFCAKRLIQATAEHFSADIPPDSQKIVDLDVSHFSLPREKYKITTELLRLEYPSISDEAFNAGRKDFLTRFLAKGFIYRTDFFKNNFEQAAIANIEQDLKEIK